MRIIRPNARPSTPTGTLRRNRPPAERLCQGGTEERTERETASGNAGPDANSHPPLPHREAARDDRQRRRHHQRRPCALEHARGDQQRPTRGEPGRERGNAEDGEAPEEDPPVPERVCEPAAGKQQRCERERVGVDDPLEAGQPQPEIAPDRRQRHAQRSVVERQQKREQSEGTESQPPPVRGRRLIPLV